MRWLPPRNRALAALFGASALLLAAVDVLAGRSPLSSVFVPALAIAAVLALVSLPQAWLRWLGVAVVSVFVVSTVVQTLTSPRLFSKGNVGSVVRYLVAGQIMPSDGMPLYLRAGTHTLHVRARYRTPDRAPSPLWNASAPGLSVRAEGTGTAAYASITSATTGARFVSRSYDTGTDMSGRRFHVELSLRCHPGTSGPCGDLDLTARAALPYSATPTGQPLHPGPTWTDVGFDWTAPKDVHATVLHVLIVGTWEGTLDIANVRVRALAGDRATPLPAVGFLTFRGVAPAAARLPDIPLRASSDWVPLDVSLPTGPVEHGRAIRVLAQAGDGAADAPLAAVRDLHITATSAAGHTLRVTPTLWRSLRARGRAQGWFSGPNLAGHSLAVIALVAIATSQSVWAVVTMSVLALFAIFLTGSRAAWLGIGLGIALYAGLRWRRHVRWLASAAVAALALGAAAIVLLGGLPRVMHLSIDAQISRPKIWSVALQAVAAHPIAGIGGDATAFRRFWLHHAGAAASTSITHAHDALLAMAAAYGLPGALVAVALVAGLIAFALRWRRYRCLPVLAAALAMNVVDFTLLYAWVWIPLVLVLASSDGAEARRPARPGVTDTLGRDAGD